MQENQIETRSITELLGLNFYIPAYQRGYRWTKTNVLQLLNDIWEYRQEKNNQNNFYCLQPVVVRKAKWLNQDKEEIIGYEIIDGQQRLTTIHRIITYLKYEFLKVNSLIGEYKADLYRPYYQTRLESEKFLSQNQHNDSTPDFYYMSEAYKTIKNWFEDKKRGFTRVERNRFLETLLPELIDAGDNVVKVYPEWSVQVIWYEINDEQQKSEDLFTRLNRGKIPLSSAELIKAKFVNADSFKAKTEQEQIKRRTQLIQIWDEIENQLNNIKFWSFISNEPLSRYSSKIEYLFDIVTQKQKDEKDPLFSFINFFDTNETSETLWAKWIVIEEIYRSLLFWYTNKNLYHKVGYLITAGKPIKDLVNYRQKLSKKTFEKKLDELIADTIPDDWQSLLYKAGDHFNIIKTLLLVNIELIRCNKNNNEFFPFELYKGISKSIEHIHAQNIDDINQNKKDEWKKWLNAHIQILPRIATDVKMSKTIVDEVTNIDYKTYTYQDFKKHSNQILDLMPKEDGIEAEYLHRIENLALLGSRENSSLSSSVFEVKRERIIAMDKAGDFVPLATKRIFLKYYSNENTHHYSVWTKKERETYLNEIQDCIGKYKREGVLNEN